MTNDGDRCVDDHCVFTNISSDINHKSWIIFRVCLNHTRGALIHCQSGKQEIFLAVGFINIKQIFGFEIAPAPYTELSVFSQWVSWRVSNSLWSIVSWRFIEIVVEKKISNTNIVILFFIYISRNLVCYPIVSFFVVYSWDIAY